MAKTKIDWCNEVWNPTWGCTYGCPFCYARKFARRFAGQVAKWNGLSQKETERLKEFKPIWLPKNFSRPLKGRVVFVNSMSDLADWKEEWIDKVLGRIRKEPKRYFLILTKRPKKVVKLLKKRELPSNLWLGASATNGRELIERTEELLKLGWGNTFASFEPMLGLFKPHPVLEKLKWVIFGAQTNPLKLPLTKDLLRATYWFKNNDIPVFHKENLSGLGIKLLKEFPF